MTCVSPAGDSSKLTLTRENVLATLSSEPLAAFPQNTTERDGGDEFGMLVWILGAVSAIKVPENPLTTASILARKWGSLWFSSGLCT